MSEKKIFIMQDDIVFGHYSCEDLDEIILNKNVKQLFCNTNNISKLDIPDSLKLLSCSNNHLTTLDLNKLEDVDCTFNKLSEITVTSSLKWLTCDTQVKIYNHNFKFELVRYYMS